MPNKICVHICASLFLWDGDPVVYVSSLHQPKSLLSAVLLAGQSRPLLHLNHDQFALGSTGVIGTILKQFPLTCFILLFQYCPLGMLLFMSPLLLQLCHQIYPLFPFCHAYPCPAQPGLTLLVTFFYRKLNFKNVFMSTGRTHSMLYSKAFYFSSSVISY